MKRYFIPLISLGFISICFADFNTGVAAYNKGDYQTALKEWEAVTKQATISNNFEWQSTIDRPIVDAQYAIALLYWQGKGVKQNYKTAEQWLIQAANAGHAEAQLKLAYLYMTGLTKTADYSNAKQWLEKAAAQNNPDAHYNLALLYFKGLAVNKDDEQAKKWLKLPVQRGDNSAIALMAEINNKSLESAPKTTTSAPTVDNISVEKNAPIIPKTDTTTINHDYYSVQLLASINQDDVTQLMQQWHSIIEPLMSFEKIKDNTQFFVLSYGIYATIAEAKQALKNLPKALKKQKPWIIKISQDQPVKMLD
ncbi:MAG: SPOR domain-containing protein [Methylococcaceae bacterium]